MNLPGAGTWRRFQTREKRPEVWEAFSSAIWVLG